MVLGNEDEVRLAPRTRKYRKDQVQRSCYLTRTYSMTFERKKEYAVLNKWWAQKEELRKENWCIWGRWSLEDISLGKCGEQKCFMQQITAAALVPRVSTQGHAAWACCPGAHSKWRQQQTLVQLWQLWCSVVSPWQQEAQRAVGGLKGSIHPTGASQGFKEEAWSQKFARRIRVAEYSGHREQHVIHRHV